MSVRIITRSIWDNPGNRGERLQRSVNAIGWQLWKRIVKRPRPMHLANGREFVAHPDCVVSSSLIYAKHPEFHELRFVRQQLRDGDFVIDIGANVGHIGLSLSDVVDPAQIIAFEPTPITYSRLRENWIANGFSTDSLYQVAVGEQEGTVQFPDLAHPGTKNSVVQDSHSRQQPTVEVEVRTLDSFRDKWSGRSIGFLKIDVEGHESSVFEGAKLTLKEDRPRLIMFESLGGEVSDPIRSALRNADYEIFQLDEHGAATQSQLSEQNLFAVPREHFSDVVSP